MDSVMHVKPTTHYGCNLGKGVAGERLEPQHGSYPKKGSKLSGLIASLA